MLILLACFTPQADPMIVETVEFSNDFTEGVTDIVLQPFTYDGLACPDGSDAKFFAVYRTGVTGVMPVVVVFHADAFDYVANPAGDDGLNGQHFTDENRLTAEFGAQKVFETLGLLTEDPDPAEVNRGSLPAALAIQNTFALYPANCWGDLWHNETGYTTNDWNADLYQREGRFMAGIMVAINDPTTQTALEWRSKLGLDAESLALNLDPEGVYLVGLGEGARAIPELLNRDVSGMTTPTIKGMILDSPVDNFYPVAVDDANWGDWNDGLARIFWDDVDDDGDGTVSGDLIDGSGYRDDITSDIGKYSLDRWIRNNAFTINTQVFYSSADPQVPVDTINNLLALDPTYENLTTTDYGEVAHVFLNGDDFARPRAAVSNLLGL
jgi:hypothetical protein